MSDAEPFDRALRRRRHALTELARAGFLHAAIADEVRDRVAAVTRDFTDVLDLGGPAPVWPGAVRLGLAPGVVDVVADAVDVVADAVDVVADVVDVVADVVDVVADEDRLPFADASFDLVVAVGGLATVSDLPGALVQARRVLRPGGLFVAAFAGGMTLAELRADLLAAEIAITGGAAARVAPMVEAQAAAGLLQRAGFADPVSDIERLSVRYGSIFGLFDDLAAMGARSVLASRSPLRRDVLAGAAARFAARATGGKTAVTIEIVHMAGWAPAASDRDQR